MHHQSGPLFSSPVYKDKKIPGTDLQKPSYLGVAVQQLDYTNTGRQNPTRMACRPNIKAVTKMPRAKRICPKPGCPNAAIKRYCQDHEREYERQRGNSNQRGYGSAHQAERTQWVKRIAILGQIQCATCPTQIKPGQPFDLGHTNDRQRYIGPQCLPCNRSDGGRRGRAGQTM